MSAVTTTLDVRVIPIPRKHPTIFKTFEDLQPGESFILVNDHDPKPLYYQPRSEEPRGQNPRNGPSLLTSR